jgi:hypothetical protein
MRLTRNRTEFSGAWTANADKVSDRKAILITGTPRGGTSFAASVFRHLGIPFSRPGQGREVSKRTHEHKALRNIFKAEDAARLREISDDFAASCPVWAWKLPQIQENLDLVSQCIANPHYVFIFKEPVSIAFRRVDVKGAEFLTAMDRSVEDYRRLLVFARQTQAPIMFIGYDTAMANVEQFIDAAAEFAGVAEFDRNAIIGAVEADAQYYYPGDASVDAEAD